MADEGYWKTASCRHSGRTGARDWNRLVCSRQSDTHGVSACVRTCVNSETRTRERRSRRITHDSQWGAVAGERGDTVVRVK